MGWKNFSYSLKMGVLGFGIGLFGIILGLLGQIPAYYFSDLKFALLVGSTLTGSAVSISFPSILLTILIGMIINIPPIFIGDSSVWGLMFLGVIVSPVIYFLIGALIGWIVGKFKNKKEVKR